MAASKCRCRPNGSSRVPLSIEWLPIGRRGAAARDSHSALPAGVPVDSGRHGLGRCGMVTPCQSSRPHLASPPWELEIRYAWPMPWPLASPVEPCGQRSMPELSLVPRTDSWRRTPALLRTRGRNSSLDAERYWLVAPAASSATQPRPDLHLCRRSDDLHTSSTASIPTLGRPLVLCAIAARCPTPRSSTLTVCDSRHPCGRPSISPGCRPFPRHSSRWTPLCDDARSS